MLRLVSLPGITRAGSMGMISESRQNAGKHPGQRRLYTAAINRWAKVGKMEGVGKGLEKVIWIAAF
jgi:hypothetical protein